MKHIKAFTYKDKIPDVKAGICTQTIRPKGKRPVAEGDQILFHGWAGKPYRTPWDWRLRVTVNEVEPIGLFANGIQFFDYYNRSWLLFRDWADLKELAVRDGIRPRMPYHAGVVMGELFNQMYKLEFKSTGRGKPFQIIRWDEPKKGDLIE